MIVFLMTEILQNFHEQIFGVDRLLIAITALILVTILGMVRGPLGGHATPFFWHLVDIAFGRFGARMDKIGRPKGDLIFRGFLLCVFVLALCFLLGRFLGVMSAHYTTWSLIEIGSLSILLTSGAVFVGVGQLYRALNNDKKVNQGAYYTVARSTRTDLSGSDDYTITRMGMGLTLKMFDKGVVAPIFWYLIAGLAGAYIYAGLAVLAWRFGREGHGSGFGSAALELEKLLGFVPNLLSGVLVALAGLLTPTAGMTRSFLGMLRFRGSASYAEGGLPLTAAAYALKVSLGGPTTDLEGRSVARSWVGPVNATAQLEAKHLHRAVYISFMAHLLFLASLFGALLFVQNGWNLALF
jgi:adenosylcobinamide-phosphate synthase